MTCYYVYASYTTISTPCRGVIESQTTENLTEKNEKITYFFYQQTVLYSYLLYEAKQTWHSIHTISCKSTKPGQKYSPIEMQTYKHSNFIRIC